MNTNALGGVPNAFTAQSSITPTPTPTDSKSTESGRHINEVKSKYDLFNLEEFKQRLITTNYVNSEMNYLKNIVT